MKEAVEKWLNVVDIPSRDRARGYSGTMNWRMSEKDNQEGYYVIFFKGLILCMVTDYG